MSTAEGAPAQKTLNVRGWLAAILLLYLVITIGYGAANPLFEAPDEQLHYFTVQHIVESRRLPQVTAEPDGWMGQEAAQPPLFYLLGALLISPVDTTLARQQVWFNPFVRLGDAGSPTNRNAFVHTPAENWPWGGPTLAGHLLRLAVTLTGAATLLCIYGGGRIAWPEQPERALTATALVAFLPQYNFLHASISNDPLVIFFCAAALWQLLYLWYRGGSRLRLTLLGVTLGLAVLSKTAGLLLLLFAAGWLVLLALRDAYSSEERPARLSRTVQLALGNLGWALLPALVISGWLLWRNWSLYGDITAANQFVRLAGGDRGYSLGQVLGESGGLWRSTFAVFGWMNIAPPNWVYLVWNGLILAAIGGALLALWRSIKAGKSGESPAATPATGGRMARILHDRRLPALLLALWCVGVYAGLVTFMLRTPAAQGRLLFPALLPLSLGVAYGLSMYRRRIVLLAAALLALLTTVYCLLFVIPPAYAAPPLVTEAQLPPEAARFDNPMGHNVELVAAQIETTEVLPGDQVWLTLYWRANEALPDAPPEMVIELFGREHDLVGKLQSYHGGGLYPATMWPVGAIVADRVGLQMDADMEVPTVVAVQVRLVDGAEPVVAGTVKAIPAGWPAAPEQPAAQLGDGIELAGVSFAPETARAGETVHVSPVWRVITPSGQTLTTFVHLGDGISPPAATGDAQPLQGYYPTHLWAAGEVIEDDYLLSVPADLPPGRYPITIGMYSGDGRLPLSVDGKRRPGDGFLVGWLTVE